MFSISTFQSDVTPPVGHPLCAGWYPDATAISDPLTAHGLIIREDDKEPVVLCALDWAELSNHEYRRWRESLADAVGTAPDKVAVHCTHSHDTPWPDREAQDILDGYGHTDIIMLADWAESVCRDAAEAARSAMSSMTTCTHISTGEAEVKEIASNRRLLGDDGKVWAVRFTRTRDESIRAAPEGIIDPMLKSIGFWNCDTKLAVLHYYTVHPTSYDGTGVVTPEFVGLARNRRIAEDGNVPHIYFTGCAGDITAGKYNDGVADNRELFTQKIHTAMRESESASERRELMSLNWVTDNIHLPPREDMTEASLTETIQTNENNGQKSRAALMLTYLRRGDMPIPITCLHLNEDVCILNLPGEAFIDYQKHAQAERSDAFVATASYGDLGTGYITLERSFDEGGYEPTDAFVSGASEAILKASINTVIRRP
jgi:hypothetical protein